MKYLLDTHTFIWAISERDKLSTNARRVIDDTNNAVYISAITFWEISLKFANGKLGINGALPHQLPQLSTDIGFKLIPLSPEECANYHLLILTTHKDPFDRMLIWQAIQRDFIFISKDENMALYNVAGLRTLW